MFVKIVYQLKTRLYLLMLMQGFDNHWKLYLKYYYDHRLYMSKPGMDIFQFSAVVISPEPVLHPHAADADNAIRNFCNGNFFFFSFFC